MTSDDKEKIINMTRSDLEDFIKREREIIRESKSLPFNERLNLFVKYSSAIDSLFKQGFLTIEAAAYEIVEASFIFNLNEMRENGDLYNVFDLSASLEVPDFPSFKIKDRPLSDWKIIEDFIEKYKNPELN